MHKASESADVGRAGVGKGAVLKGLALAQTLEAVFADGTEADERLRDTRQRDGGGKTGEIRQRGDGRGLTDGAERRRSVAVMGESIAEVVQVHCPCGGSLLCGGRERGGRGGGRWGARGRDAQCMRPLFQCLHASCFLSALCDSQIAPVCILVRVAHLYTCWPEIRTQSADKRSPGHPPLHNAPRRVFGRA